MRNGLLSIAAVAAISAFAGGAQAEGVLAYSFESGVDGFGPNGAGISMVQDTIGATHLDHSMKVSVVQGQTFAGALTDNLHPSIGDPPGVRYVLFDMTIEEEFTGAFAVVGVTMWGCTQGGVSCGNPFQFADFEHIGGKAPGTYTDIRIDLDNSLHPHPITFEGGLSFNEIFGPNPGAPNDIIPTHFQLYFNKSNDQALTVYIDNIRMDVPEPTTGLLSLLGVAAMGLVVRRPTRS